jgi:Calpain family cysteine protease
MTKEYNIIVEKDPIDHQSANLKKDSYGEKLDMSKMGDNRDWLDYRNETFDAQQGMDMSCINLATATYSRPGERAVSGGMFLDPGFNPHSYDMEKSVSFIAQSSLYEKLQRELESTGTVYTDPKFKPEFSSIAGFGDLHGYPENYLRNIKWKRPDEIFGQTYCIFDEDIEPNDIQQGILGNCYFLAAIAAIAEFPNRIKRLFLSRNVTRTGAYCVTICVNGIWEEIILDDLIPVKPDGTGKDIAFNHTSDKELWGILLEKAWAKVHGGYMNTDGGLIREALRDLTGAPCKSFFSQLDSPDVHWKRLEEGETNNWIMCAGSDDLAGTGNDSRDNKTGLSGNHAYSVLACYELEPNGYGGYRKVAKGTKSTSRTEKIVKMRNPWGKGEWKGSWSDGDTQKWTPETRQLLGHTAGDDGQFFLPFTDFLKFFHDYQICFYEENYKYSAKRYKSSSERPTIVEFRVEQAGDYYFTINQVNSRFFKKNDRKYH